MSLEQAQAATHLGMQAATLHTPVNDMQCTLASPSLSQARDESRSVTLCPSGGKPDVAKA